MDALGEPGSDGSGLLLGTDDRAILNDCVARLDGLFADLTAATAPGRLADMANEAIRREAEREAELETRASSDSPLRQEQLEEALARQREELESRFGQRIAEAKEKAAREARRAAESASADAMRRLREAAAAANERADAALAETRRVMEQFADTDEEGSDGEPGGGAASRRRGAQRGAAGGMSGAGARSPGSSP